MSRMLETIKKHGSRTTIEQAMHYAARGNVEAIRVIYVKIVGHN